MLPNRFNKCFVPGSSKGTLEHFPLRKGKRWAKERKFAELIECGYNATYVTPRDTARIITVVTGGEYPFVTVSCKTMPISKMYNR